MGFLDRLFGRSRHQGAAEPTAGASAGDDTKPISTRVCDVCNADFNQVAGYYLPTRDVVLAERYWAKSFSVTKTLSDAFGMSESELTVLFDSTLQQYAGQSSAWAVCENCSEYFVFDRDLARAHAVNGTQPSDCGPVEPSDCVLFAALGWERVFGHWPANVQRMDVVDKCDLCEKSMYGSEFTAFVRAGRMREMRSEGLIDTDPARPARQHQDNEGFILCQPCMARLLARIYRAVRPPSERDAPA